MGQRAAHRRKSTYEEIIARDKTNLDIFWLKDDSLTDLDNLPDPNELAEEVTENLETGLARFWGWWGKRDANLRDKTKLFHMAL